MGNPMNARNTDECRWYHGHPATRPRHRDAFRAVDSVGIMVDHRPNERLGTAVVIIGWRVAIGVVPVRMFRLVFVVRRMAVTVAANVIMRPRRVTFRLCNVRSTMRMRMEQALVGQHHGNEQ